MIELDIFESLNSHIFSCSYSHIFFLEFYENYVQVRLEYLGEARDDPICVVNLFGFLILQWFVSFIHLSK